MSMHWVVVGDGEAARVYASNAMLEELSLVDQLHHAHGHVTHGGKEKTASMPGAGAGVHEAHHDNRREIEERFARAVAQVLEQGSQKHAFERVILVAPPRFLGDLRGALGHGARERVVASIHHDWTKLGLRELAANIRKALPEAAGM